MTKFKECSKCKRQMPDFLLDEVNLRCAECIEREMDEKYEKQLKFWQKAKIHSWNALICLLVFNFPLAIIGYYLDPSYIIISAICTIYGVFAIDIIKLFAIST